MSPGPAAQARLGFDAIRALRNSTGLGNYARAVLSGLHSAAPSASLHLYSPRSPRSEFHGFAAQVGGTLHLPRPGLRRPLVREWWRTFRLGRAVKRHNIDLYHGLTQEIPRDLPRTGVPSVVTVADLLYHTHPELFPAIDRRSYTWRYRWSAEHANAVVAISRWTRDQLHDAFHIPLDRIVVVPPARDPRFSIAASAAELRTIRERYHLPEKFMIAVGTLEPRKHQLAAVEALALLDPATMPLVLVGRDGGSEAIIRARIEKLTLTERVHILGNVTHADLPTLMQGASLALYLSRAEGFGMPIVEALSTGLPVIAAMGPHLRDAGGEIAHYVDGSDPVAIAEMMDHLLKTTPDAVRSAAGRQHAERFDALALARELLGVYDAVIEGRHLPTDSHPNHPDRPRSAEMEPNG